MVLQVDHVFPGFSQHVASGSPLLYSGVHTLGLHAASPYGRSGQWQRFAVTALLIGTEAPHSILLLKRPLEGVTWKR